ncbi:MAG TPA: hypothetical protein VFT69_14750, partial [Pseudolabrys sp.]|nr:hypothetical protein [Pseudolabrys sp.]
RAQIRTRSGAPVLSAHFEASVPGLYFIGTTGLYSFGPLMRFVAGTQFAASRVCRHVAQHLAWAKQPSLSGSAAKRASPQQIVRAGETPSSHGV